MDRDDNASGIPTLNLGPRAALPVADQPMVVKVESPAVSIPVYQVLADFASAERPNVSSESGRTDDANSSMSLVESVSESSTNAGTIDESSVPSAVRQEWSVGRVVGPYFIESEIGEGGMGTVYKAKQLKPVKRTVALKMIRTGRAGKEAVQRFLAERQALAMMDHPEIARILDAGTEGDQPYFVMEFADGVPLDKYCDQRRLGIRDRARLVLRVCRAIQHAHEKGVIHRDIKPSNVLVHDVQGQPVVKVIDFGIAKALDDELCEDGPRTCVGQMVGTPLYMSPEQAAGSDVDARADVYSLGAMLHVLLTGRTPLTLEASEWKSISTIVQRVTSHESEPPTRMLEKLSSDELRTVAEQRGTTSSGLRRQIKGDLNWIALKALAPQRPDRYATAGDLADDLQNYLEDHPVRAAAPTWRYRAVRYVRRHRTLALVAAGIGVTLVLSSIAGGLLVWRNQQIEQHQQDIIAADVRKFLDKAQTARNRPTKDQAAWRDGLSHAENELVQAEALMPQLRGRASLANEVAAFRRELRLDLAAADTVDAMHQARDLGMGADAMTGSGDQTRSVNALREALKSCGIVPGETDPRSAAKQLLRFPVALHEDITESLDFLLNEDLLGTGVTCEVHNDTLLIDSIDRRVSERIAECAKKNASPKLDENMKLVGLREAGSQSDFEDVSSFTPDEVTRRFAGQPGTKVELLVESEEHGRFVTSIDRIGEEAHWAAAVLSEFDPHPWRTRLRAAILKADHDTLRQLAIVDDLARQSPFSLIQLSGKLPEPEYSTDAIRILYVAQETHPNNYWANQYLGMALQVQAKRSDPLEAARFFTAASVLNPGSPQPYKNAGFALMSAQRFSPAIQLLKRALELAPQDHYLRFTLARLLHTLRRYDEAVAQYEEMLRLTPDDADLMSYLGEIYELQERLDDQIKLYQKAVTLDPESMSPGYRLARALRKAGRESEAVQEYERLLKDGKPDVDSFRMLYAQHPEDSDTPWSPNHVRLALSKPLTAAERHKWHGYILQQITEPPAALSALEESLRLNPDDVDTHYILGLTHESLRNSAAAVEAYQHVLALAPSHQFATARLAALAEKKKKKS